MRLRGPQGTVWRKDVVIRPTFDENGESPYVIPVLDETLSLASSRRPLYGQRGDDGAARTRPAASASFYVSDRADLPKLHGAALYQAGLAPDAVRLLEEQGASVHALDPPISRRRDGFDRGDARQRRRLTAFCRARGAART